MKQSALFGQLQRETPTDAENISHALMIKSGLIRQLASGVYSYLPLGYRVLRKFESIIHEEMNRAGAQGILMPAVQPLDLWQQSGRADVYGPELIRFKDRHSRDFVLGPTHEEVITSLVRDEIGSYKRLPVTLYQIQTKFRDERRPRSGLLRGREFLMKDAYSFDTSFENLDVSYQNMYAAYERIFNRCVIVFRAVEADAGAIGGEGGTHEFIALSEVGEDTILICPSCDYAANVEVAADISEGDSCPRCHAGVISSLKGIEIGHVFKLGTKYSEALGAKFLDASGKENPIIMGCYGIGVSRLLATYIEQNHDDLGIIWKPEIAPFHVHLVQVSLKDEAQQTVSNEIYETLTSHGIETLWDDRDERPGVKFNESDLMGIPVRIVIGKHASDGNVELIKRATNERRIVSKDKVLEAISDLLK